MGAVSKAERPHGFVWRTPRELPILTLELGPATGWALRWDSKHMTSGTATFVQRDGETGGEMLFRFRTWLREHFSFAPFGLVVYRAQSRQALNQQFEGLLLGELEAAKERRQLLEYVAPTPQQLWSARAKRPALCVESQAPESGALELLAWTLHLMGERPITP